MNISVDDIEAAIRCVTGEIDVNEPLPVGQFSLHWGGNGIVLRNERGITIGSGARHCASQIAAIREMADMSLTGAGFEHALRIVKEMYWLAWQACGGTTGMGHFQDCPDATEEDVWGSVTTQTDINQARGSACCSLYADYVFGRMMKMGLGIDINGVISWSPADTRPDYQSWTRSGKYSGYEDVYAEAAGMVEKEEEDAA